MANARSDVRAECSGFRNIFDPPGCYLRKVGAVHESLSRLLRLTWSTRQAPVRAESDTTSSDSGTWPVFRQLSRSLSHVPSACCLSESVRCASACPTMSIPTILFQAFIKQIVIGPGTVVPMDTPLRLLTGPIVGLVLAENANSAEYTS